MSVNCPKGEWVWQTVYDKEHKLRFFITSKPQRDFYFLYSVEPDGAVKKLGKDRTPPALLEKYRVTEACRDGK